MTDQVTHTHTHKHTHTHTHTHTHIPAISNECYWLSCSQLPVQKEWLGTPLLYGMGTLQKRGWPREGKGGNERDKRGKEEGGEGRKWMEGGEGRGREGE